MMTSLLNQASFHIPLTPLVLVVIFCILAAASLVHAIILRYHWKHYGTGALELTKTSLIYFVGLGVLLAGMLTFILAYSATN